MVLFSGGCETAGPTAIREGRGSYNLAIQQTNDEQLLLNLVRLRYLDTPYFVTVSSISTGLNLTTGLSGSASIPESSRKSFGLSGSLSYVQRPTVTYAPLQGERFVAQVLSPVSLPKLVLLYHSGWSVEQILRVCVQSLNAVPNAPTASGPTPAATPMFREFLEAARLVVRLQKEGSLKISLRDMKGETGILLHVLPEAKDRDDVKRLRKLLNLPDNVDFYILTPDVAGTGPNHIRVATRSLMATMFYLSQLVSVPERDEKAGRVIITRDEKDRRFDWSELGGDLLKVRWASLPPANAYVSVFYRGVWFYIDDSDMASKSTFALLTQLFALQAGTVKTERPVLTIPVGQ
jgi:hypothetical protein